MSRRLPTSTLFPYTTLFRSEDLPRVQRLAEFFNDDADLLIRHGRRRAHVDDLALVIKRGELEVRAGRVGFLHDAVAAFVALLRSEEHTSELQSHSDLVCRLL